MWREEKRTRKRQSSKKEHQKIHRILNEVKTPFTQPPPANAQPAEVILSPMWCLKPTGE